MTAVSILSSDDGTVKARLIRAADAEIAAHGMSALQMDAIAKRVGLSRATAFRQLGGISEVLIRVALLRAERHRTAAQQLMDARTGAFAKIEAALVYNARELPADPAIAALIARHSGSMHDPRVHQAAAELLGPVLQEGQRHGEVRTDLELDEMVDFLVEQTCLAAEEIDRSETAVLTRCQHFVIPALEARGSSDGEYISYTREVEAAVSAAQEALERLGRKLRQAKSSDKDCAEPP